MSRSRRTAKLLAGAHTHAEKIRALRTIAKRRSRVRTTFRKEIEKTQARQAEATHARQMRRKDAQLREKEETIARLRQQLEKSDASDSAGSDDPADPDFDPQTDQHAYLSADGVDDVMRRAATFKTTFNMLIGSDKEEFERLAGMFTPAILLTSLDGKLTQAAADECTWRPAPPDVVKQGARAVKKYQQEQLAQQR